MKANKKNKKNKNAALSFDENERKKFLCGFRKRKVVRQQKAQEELQQRLVTEKTKVKNDLKESKFPAEERSKFQELTCKKLELEGYTISILDLNVQC